MAERSTENFWSAQQFKFSSFESNLFKENVSKSSLDYLCGGKFDEKTEKNLGNRLVLSGPLIDFYLEDMGRKMLSKLIKSKTTGLASPIVLSLPWEIVGKICSLCVCYGANLKNEAKRSKERQGDGIN